MVPITLNALLPSLFYRNTSPLPCHLGADFPGSQRQCWESLQRLKHIPFSDISDVFDEKKYYLTDFFLFCHIRYQVMQTSFFFFLLIFGFQSIFSITAGLPKGNQSKYECTKMRKGVTKPVQPAVTSPAINCSEHASPTELFPFVLRELWRALDEKATMSHNQDTRLSWKAWTREEKREHLDGRCEKLNVGILWSNTAGLLYITREGTSLLPPLFILYIAFILTISPILSSILIVIYTFANFILFWS